jgi:hypothetical protein
VSAFPYLGECEMRVVFRGVDFVPIESQLRDCQRGSGEWGRETNLDTKVVLSFMGCPIDVLEEAHEFLLVEILAFYDLRGGISVGHFGQGASAR